MATAMTLYWYQLDSGTLAPTYYGQLNATVAELCTENSVTAPTAPWYNQIACSLVSEWLEQIDTAVRALCTALSVTPMTATLPNLNSGQYMATYWAQLDVTVRALVEADSYTGPLDLVPGAVAAWSPARALSTAMIGQNIIKLRRASDDELLDFVAGVDGSVDAAAVATWAGGDVFCHTMYDQSGNAVHAVQTDLTKQPEWVASVQGGRPGLGTNEAETNPSQLDLTGNMTFASGGFSFFAVSKARAASSIPQLVASNEDETAYIDMQRGANFSIDTYNDPNEAGATYALGDANCHALDAQWEFGSITFRIDGVVQTPTGSNDDGAALGSFTTATTAVAGASATIYRIASDDGVERELENIIYASKLTGGNATLIRDNQETYYSL